MIKPLLAALGTALLMPLASAATLDAAKSELSFGFKQMGVPVEGRFKKFEAQLDFDPKKPETGKIAFSVDLASVSLGDPAYDAELGKATWFDTKRNGKASFVSTGIKAAGPGRFDVAGKLTIKGASHDVVVPLSLTSGSGASTATGSLTIKRLDFKIGEGEWADTSMVANDVLVKFKLNVLGL
jgi:polyisoprenoid-binding protein YceI